MVHVVTKIMTLALSVVFLASKLANADNNFSNCMAGYKSLCDETVLSTEQLGKLNQTRSADMLKTCQITRMLCKKDVLLPADLEKLD